jgi:hypothetical protein
MDRGKRGEVDRLLRKIGAKEDDKLDEVLTQYADE